ncbi:MAG: FprA family A-type flavoprotein [Prevotellaceae bacterium]|jgi:flavorubredoxin|nr:FprA family A-type flavoprotein [Prevotellaceae bacterium]
MKVTTTLVKGRVHYVGVNDTTKHLFENLWVLPYGVSYNSYLIADDKVALVDTVDARMFSEYLTKIRQVIGERPIDYLIINHMEPDHSGAIKLIRQYYPQITIVGNKQTFGMIEGFYGIYDNRLVVKDGETLDLGHHKLTFHLTPMVHWPETMMTYDATEQILFSGDAFGCFGALAGAYMDTNMDTTPYWDEMIRYYACIVGKYGEPVQRALKKLSGLSLQVIASTHGPVWTEEITRVVGVYDRLSRYEPDRDGVLIIYGSMYGNTERMAEVIAAQLSADGIKDICVHPVSTSDISDILKDVFRYKYILLGSPTYNGEIFPAVESVMHKIAARQVKNRTFGFFGSYSWAGAAVKKMKAFAEANNWQLIGDPVEMKHAMTPEIEEQCKRLADATAQR